MSRDEFVSRVQEDLERRRIAKYMLCDEKPILGYKAHGITKRMRREKRRYYR